VVSDYKFYRKNCPLNSSLRNRSTGAKMDDIGRQQMVNIQCQDRFIGATCTNNHLYLITKEMFKIPILAGNIIIRVGSPAKPFYK